MLPLVCNVFLDSLSLKSYLSFLFLLYLLSPQESLSLNPFFLFLEIFKVLLDNSIPLLICWVQLCCEICMDNSYTWDLWSVRPTELWKNLRSSWSLRNWDWLLRFILDIHVSCSSPRSWWELWHSWIWSLRLSNTPLTFDDTCALIFDHLLDLLIQLVKVTFVSVPIVDKLCDFSPDDLINLHLTSAVDVVLVSEFVDEELDQLDALLGSLGVSFGVRLCFDFGVHSKMNKKGRRWYNYKIYFN